jgi:hypothetical protein
VTTEQQTLKHFIEKYKLSFSVKSANSNPNMDGKMNHYIVTIAIGERYSPGRHEMETVFSMGLGLKGIPKLEDVLDCLASDSSGYENVDSFEDWCQEYGYDTDSRQAVQIYHAVSEQAKQLEHFLAFAAPEAYQELLYSTEKL